MAHKKDKEYKNGRDSVSKRLGVKIGSEMVVAGNILLVRRDQIFAWENGAWTRLHVFALVNEMCA
jgi:ribosomal protein L27